MINTTEKQGSLFKMAVLKFGGALLSEPRRINQAIHETYQFLRKGYRVLLVVSSMDIATDPYRCTAIDELSEEGFVPPVNEFAELIATKETAIACQLSIALDKHGIKAKKLSHQCLLTKNLALNADPESLTTDLILSLFKIYSVLVLPGAIGNDPTRKITLLGPKGADYTAVFAAHCLHAEQCIIYTEKDGIYKKSPSPTETESSHYTQIQYQDFLKNASFIIHHKAIKFAEAHEVSFTIKSPISFYQTQVEKGPSVLSSILAPSKKLKIALLGLGTVGYGVYQHIIAHDHLFELIGVGVKNHHKHESKNLPKALLSDNWESILQHPCDIVVVLIQDDKPKSTETMIRHAINKGCHVITANRTLVASKGKALSDFATQRGVKFLYSAAVGGAIPILENLEILRKSKLENPIQSIYGVLNSTCNIALDKVKQGLQFHHSIALTQRLGLGENGSSSDLYGFDASQKATLLSRAAFGRDPDSIELEGIQSIDEFSFEKASLEGKNIRLILKCSLDNDKIKATIAPQLLDSDHPLSQVIGVHNAVLINTSDGQSIELHGKGTGRWPIAESVFSDLLALSAEFEKDQLTKEAANLKFPNFSQPTENHLAPIESTS